MKRSFVVLASLVSVSAFFACGGSTEDATEAPNENAGQHYTRPGTDDSTGSAVNADTDAGAPAPPPACPNLASMGVDPEPFVPIFETPEGVELRAAHDGTILGYDANAKQFVLYSVSAWVGKDVPPDVSEELRLDPSYDRAGFAWTNTMYACGQSGCDIFNIYSIDHVPDELEPRAFSEQCAAGKGIACWDAPSKHWVTMVPASTFAFAIESFASLGDGTFVVIDPDKKAWRVRNGAVSAWDIGTDERVKALSPDTRAKDMIGYHASALWSALTESGHLVLGNADSAHTCPDTFGYMARSYRDLLLEQEGALHAVSRKHPLPEGEGSFQAGETGCGGVVPYVFDAHRVFGKNVSCALD